MSNAYLVADIPAGDTQVETLAGKKLTLANTNDSITVTTTSAIKAMVMKQDIKSDHSVVQATEHVLTP
ncbi:MAG: hypothetical protein DI629_19280 [Mesorhizobium amorphae]|nr:MAG: hypothetical protein DI629_19280 [Mesorhizobium amorphae]